MEENKTETKSELIGENKNETAPCCMCGTAIPYCGEINEIIKWTFWCDMCDAKRQVIAMTKGHYDWIWDNYFTLEELNEQYDLAVKGTPTPCPCRDHANLLTPMGYNK
jgi:hypothetical protein